ncbi:hypothetical protein RB653_004529 [Dictyostelium firmibasis]|uniref:Uncharacterized protein n=1 Tax=Dictyostelium firmibasis TaxID=79012 RepID=A0AAN7U7Y6_9MYCE
MDRHTNEKIEFFLIKKENQFVDQLTIEAIPPRNNFLYIHQYHQIRYAITRKEIQILS